MKGKGFDDVTHLQAEVMRLQLQVDHLMDKVAEHEQTVDIYQLITRHVGDLLAIVDPEGRRIWNNRAYRETLGYSPEELARTDSFVEIHPEDRAKVKHVFEESLRSGAGGEMRYRMKHKAGHWVPLESKAQVVRNEDGSARAVVIVARDIADRIRSEDEQVKLQKMDSLAAFSQKVAEQFNQYISVIVAKVSLVRKGLPIDSVSTMHLVEVMKVADQAQRLVREMLSISKGSETSHDKVDLRELLASCVGNSVPMGLGIKLQQQLSPHEVWISASASTLGEALAQLIKNAVESMPKGGVLQISLVVDKRNRDSANLQAGTYACIRIRDQGIGIPTHIKKRIFEPYYSTKEGHQGLGLSSALAAVSEHGGRIEVESKPRVGTEVTIYLPVMGTEPAVLKEKPVLTGEPKMAARRVLILDDEAFVREFSVAMFQQLGFQATAVESEEELMTEFKDAQRRREAYQLVIADMISPDGEGGEKIAVRVRSISPFTKLLAVSGQTDHHVLLDPNNYGFHAAMAKPYRLQRIREVLAELFPS